MAAGAGAPIADGADRAEAESTGKRRPPRRGREAAGARATLDVRRSETAPAASARGAAADAAPKPAIISPVAGRQVAAAFGELSEAFAARSKKTFDELAEQMLRPMLQEWLDNNLPVLVERLVREEIERVARGVE